MPIWIVNVVWKEDTSDVMGQWQANAETAHEAIAEVTSHLRFAPHHVEAKAAETDNAEPRLLPGEIRRLPT